MTRVVVALRHSFGKGNRMIFIGSLISEYFQDRLILSSAIAK